MITEREIKSQKSKCKIGGLAMTFDVKRRGIMRYHTRGGFSDGR